jgi:hypothetical protein
MQAEARSAVTNCRGKYRSDGFVQPTSFVRVDLPPRRMDARPVQDLVCVNVAEAGHGALAEENGLDWGLRTGEVTFESFPVETARKGFRSHFHKRRATPIVPASDDSQATESTAIDKDQKYAVIQLDYESHMRCDRDLGRCEESAAHSQVDDQLKFTQHGEQILPSPPQVIEAESADPWERLRCGTANRNYALPHNGLRQITSYRLDFG